MAAEAVLEDKGVAGTVHRLDRHGSFLDDIVKDLAGVFGVTKLELGEEHVLQVVVVVAGRVPKLFGEDQRGFDFDVSCSSDEPFHVVGQSVPEDRAFG